MEEHGLLLKGEMVRAVLEGRKTQTRTPLRKQPPPEVCNIRRGVTGWCEGFDKDEWNTSYGIDCPWQIGDRLWVRETWTIYLSDEGTSSVFYKADRLVMPLAHSKWRPSIHMPRWASRINLEITGVRVERIQDIRANEKDLIAEGMHREDKRSYSDEFHDLWDSIYAKKGYGWAKNPWVWVREFRGGGLR